MSERSGVLWRAELRAGCSAMAPMAPALAANAKLNAKLYLCSRRGQPTAAQANRSRAASGAGRQGGRAAGRGVLIEAVVDGWADAQVSAVLVLQCQAQDVGAVIHHTPSHRGREQRERDGNNTRAHEQRQPSDRQTDEPSETDQSEHQQPEHQQRQASARFLCKRVKECEGSVQKSQRGLPHATPRPSPTLSPTHPVPRALLVLCPGASSGPQGQ